MSQALKLYFSTAVAPQQIWNCIIVYVTDKRKGERQLLCCSKSLCITWGMIPAPSNETISHFYMQS